MNASLKPVVAEVMRLSHEEGWTLNIVHDKTTGPLKKADLEELDCILNGDKLVVYVVDDAERRNDLVETTLSFFEPSYHARMAPVTPDFVFVVWPRNLEGRRGGMLFYETGLSHAFRSLGSGKRSIPFMCDKCKGGCGRRA